MSTLVCEKSSSLFQDFPTTSSTFSKKRYRCSTSQIRRSPPRTETNTPITSPTTTNSTNSPSATVSTSTDSLDRLQFIFPAMEIKVLQKTLEESDDFESAIMSLIQLCLGSSTDVDDDQKWLFEEPNKRSKNVSDAVASSGYGNGSVWPPRACYLPEADVYALPYTLPF